MCVTTEDFKEFIGDEKYVGVREYLLSAFKCVDKLTDLIINNPKCKSIVIGETIVPVTELPFVYYYPFAPNEYHFLDEDGNELN